VTDARRYQNAEVLERQLVQETTHVNEAVHHLRDAEAVAEVVERVVAVVLLHAELQPNRCRHLAYH
jgi:hypothetical protein